MDSSCADYREYWDMCNKFATVTINGKLELRYFHNLDYNELIRQNSILDNIHRPCKKPGIVSYNAEWRTCNEKA